MALFRGILGQQAPAASTPTDLYTCPVNKNATIRVTVTNRSTAATFRVWVAVGGVSTSNEQYLAYDKAIAANEAFVSKAFMVDETDVVRVQASSANVSFVATGMEHDK